VCLLVLILAVLLSHKFDFLAAGEQRRIEVNQVALVFFVFVGTTLHYNWR